ncbi:MAG: c-type cytochrome [Pseudomonadota bacterium]
MAASCSGCHRAPGSGDAIPSIEGWDAAALQASLTSYKADPDGTGVMHRIARGYSVDEIADIADYLGAAE